MKRMLATVVLVFGPMLAGTTVKAQEPSKPAPAPTPTIASVLDGQLKAVEGEFVSAAEAMPEDKYSFAPTSGEFKGVRTFGEQVKHVAAANHLFFGGLVGEKSTVDPEKGPDDVKTKEQILKYLKDSFALAHRAIATITAENAVTPLTGPDGKPQRGLFGTRLGLATIGCWHPMDHYGQMVEYLRMNGIVPPASRPRPAPAKM